MKLTPMFFLSQLGKLPIICSQGQMRGADSDNLHFLSLQDKKEGEFHHLVP
jgi:hypothetical protein